MLEISGKQYDIYTLNIIYIYMYTCQEGEYPENHNIYYVQHNHHVYIVDKHRKPYTYI